MEKIRLIDITNERRFWFAVKVGKKFQRIEKVYAIGNDVWRELFAVKTTAGKIIPRYEFNRMDCIEGDDIAGYRIWRAGV